MWWGVSILVVVDIGLRLKRCYIIRNIDNEVSILVVVDIGLRLHKIVEDYLARLSQSLL